MVYRFALTDSLKDVSTTLGMAYVIWYLITLSYHQGVVLFNHAVLIRDTGFLKKKGVSRHKSQLISHYTCRDTPFSLIFHVSRAGLITFH